MRIPGKLGRLLEGREVASIQSGDPKYLEPLQDEAPKGWIGTGYPWYAIDTPEHRRFVNNCRARFKDDPRLRLVVGYDPFRAIGR